MGSVVLSTWRVSGRRGSLCLQFVSTTPQSPAHRIPPPRMTRAVRGCAVILHYLLSARWLWAGLTLALLLPGSLVQALSFAWHRSDGCPRSFSLGLVHFLQLGILKRYVDYFRAVFRCGGDQPTERELLMKEGDLCVLRLLEALVQALPHSLLQVYVYLALDHADAYAAASALASLLSLSWALVSYSRFLGLLKPGHLSMPWASLLCQLFWRMGMISTRVMALVVFARVYHFWVFAVTGTHWLVMSFWLVAQQTDIISEPRSWRFFNVLMGAIYIFCFVNLKDGRSRYRAGVFYTIMLLENSILLLLATDFLQEAPWSNVKLCVAVMSGFLIGCAALIVYYALLHPKSTEITHDFRSPACASREKEEKKDEPVLSSLCWNGATRKAADKSFGTEDLKVDVRCDDKETEARNEQLAPWMDVSNKHHHWLFLQLAMKTGNVSKINAAFGDSMFLHVTTPGAVENIDERVRTSSSDTSGSKHVSTGKSETLGCEGSPRESSDYVTLQNTRAAEAAEVGTVGGMSSDDIGLPNGEKLFLGTRAEGNAVCSPGSSAGLRDGATLYFSADMEGVVSPTRYPGPIADLPEPCAKLFTDIKDVSVPDNADEELHVISVSPILSLAANRNFQRSVIMDMGSLCDESTLSGGDSEVLENLFGRKGFHLLPASSLLPSLKGRLMQEEEPCFTSTPKASSSGADPERHVEAKARRKLTQLTEKT